MGDTRWRAADPATLRRVMLGDLTAIYHRPSGQTHVVAEPAPQILQALTGGPLTVAALMAALAGGTLPGTSYSQSQAYLNYIRRLQNGQSGFTCYASLQMPGR